MSAWQVGDEAWRCDSGESTSMTPSADGMINYKECNLNLRIADGSTGTIEGYGVIKFVFRSGNGLEQESLTNIAHVPDLRHHLFSRTTLVKNRHAFERRPPVIVLKLESERPLTWNLYRLFGYRVDCSTRGDACAVLAPAKRAYEPGVNINDNRCAAAHSHGALIRKMRNSKGSTSKENCWSAKGPPW